MFNLFNANILDQKESAFLFNAGEKELDSLLLALADQAPTRHQLILAQWGGGKSHFLSMLINKVYEDETLASGWRSVAIYGRDSSHATFLLFLGSLMSRIISLNDFMPYQDEYHRIREGTAEPDALCDQTGRLLQRMTRETGKRILLLIDDLDLFLDFILHDPLSSKRLKSLFSLNESLTVVGAVTLDPSKNKKRAACLPSLFERIDLPPLDFKRALSLLKKRASLRDDTLLSNKLESQTPCLNALFHYIRGNPRLVMELYRIISGGYFPAPARIFSELLDTLSPHYRFLIQNTPAKERKLLDTLLRSDRYASPSEAARRLGWEGKEVSVLLSRLIARGLVRKVKMGRKKSLYGAADPLFCAYYHTRFVEDLNNRAAGLVDFFHTAYSIREWDARIAQAEKESDSPIVQGLYYMEPPPPAGMSQSVQEAYQLLREKKTVRLQSKLSDIPQGNNRERGALLFMMGFAHSMEKEHQKAVACYGNYSEHDPENPWVLNNMGCDYRFIGQTEKGMECFLKSLELRSDSPLTLANTGETSARLGNYGDATAYFLRMERAATGKPLLEALEPPMVHVIFNAYSLSLEKLLLQGKLDEAREFFELRLPFIGSLPRDMILPALIRLLSPLVKPDRTDFLEQALETIKADFHSSVARSLAPFSVAVKCVTTGLNKTLPAQNLDTMDAVKLVMALSEASGER